MAFQRKIVQKDAFAATFWAKAKLSIFQVLAICLVLTAESLNTAIEKIADFIHPDHNKKIGFIKDISAGAVFFAAIFALFIIYNIYWDKILN